MQFAGRLVKKAAATFIDLEDRFPLAEGIQAAGLEVLDQACLLREPLIYALQSSNFSPLTRRNSRALLVTSVRSRARA